MRTSTLFMLGITNLLLGICNVAADGTVWVYCLSFFASGLCLSAAMFYPFS